MANLIREREIDGIETLGAFRAATADLPDDVTMQDLLGDGLLATVWRNSETDERIVEIA